MQNDIEAIKILTEKNIVLNNTKVTANENTGVTKENYNEENAQVETMKVTTKGATTYNDVNDRDIDAVNYVTEKGYMLGTNDDTFNPDGKITRATMASVLYNMAGKPEVSGNSQFNDVTNTAWYSKAVIWAAENGIVSGDDAGKFNPNDEITNEQALTMLRQYGNYMNLDTNAYLNISDYSDYGNVSDWAKETMSWAVDNWVYKGDTLNPQAGVTRSDLANYIKGFETTYANDIAFRKAGINPILSKNVKPDINPIQDNINSTPKDNTSNANDTQTPKEEPVHEAEQPKPSVVDVTADSNSSSDNHVVETMEEKETIEKEPEEVPVTSKYTDVSGEIAKAANYVSERGIMVGTDEYKFSPNSTLTRAQLVQTLYAMSGKPYTGQNNTFRDVDDSKWYGDAVTWAQNVGLVAGYTDGTFRPDQAVTKEEMTAILKQFANLAGKNTNNYNISSINSYGDVNDASNYARESLAWAKENGIINPTGNSLNPKAELTRAELAVALMAFDQGYNNGTGRVNNIKTAKTNPNKKVDDAAILNSIQQRYNSMPGKPYSGMCGALVCDMLQSQGLISDADRVSNGCDQAFAFARNGKTSTGYKVIGYPMNKDNDKAQFEKMIADNNGSVENVVVSIAGYSGVNDPEYGNRGPAGHVILISKIEGGNVYFIDNWKLTNNKPTKMSIDEFEHKVFDRYGDGCYMAVVTNQKV